MYMHMYSMNYQNIDVVEFQASLDVLTNIGVLQHVELTGEASRV